MLQQVRNKHPEINVKAILIPPTDVLDKDIIQQIKNGDVNAYGSIMRRYNQRMFRIARSITMNDAAAMDTVQEAHIKAYTHLHEYQGRSSLFSWLAGITRNESLMYLRKNRKEVSMQEDDLQSLDSSDIQASNNITNLPDTSLENKQLQKLINHHLDKLPEGFRTVFVLRAIEQCSVKETAEILQIKQETVKTRYFRAKHLLRKQLQQYIESAGLQVYEFGGHHCDILVFNVLSHIQQNPKQAEN